MSDSGSRPPGRARTDGRGRRLGLIGALIVLLGAGAGAIAALNRPGAPAPDPEPVVLPTPTPTIEPVDWERATAFQEVLPAEVLAFALSGEAEAIDLINAGAVEAYDLGYTDGAAEIRVRASQWRTVEAARAAADAVRQPPAADSAGAAEATTGQATDGPAETGATGAGATEPVLERDGPVLVSGAEAGRVTIFVVGEESRATWSNGATVIQVDGPAGAVAAFYDAFPI